MLENLITDRTLADVEAVKRLAETIKNGTATAEQVHTYLNVHQKGAYTCEDLNRVEAAVAYVVNRLNTFGYRLAIYPMETWSVDGKPNAAYFTQYFWNVAQIRDAITVWKHTPHAPDSIANFDVTKANALEQILVDVEQILNHIQAAWFFVGDIYFGEV